MLIWTGFSLLVFVDRYQYEMKQYVRGLEVVHIANPNEYDTVSLGA